MYTNGKEVFVLARDEKVIIRLREDVKKEFQRIAEEYGLTISALGAFVIGKFVSENSSSRKGEKEEISE